jgi:hypothetical protein
MSGGLEWWSTRPKIHWFAEGSLPIPWRCQCAVEYEQCGSIGCMMS